MIRLMKWVFLNRIISMAAIALSALISAYLCYEGFVLIKAIPTGATTWNDYANPVLKTGFGPGFNYIIFGIPLFLIFGGELIFSLSRRPSRLISSVAIIQILLFILFVLMTK